MSLARPARSIFGRCLRSPGRTPSPAPTVVAGAAAAQCLQFHSSVPRGSRRRSAFRNVKAEELGLTKPETMKGYQAENYAEYTKEELEKLKDKYSPEQMAALEAGEKAIDPQDLIWQGRLRDDMFRPEYLDDYSKLDPRFDLKPEVKDFGEEPYFPDEAAFQEDYFKKMTKLAEKTSNAHISRGMLRALRKAKESQGEDMIDLTYEELADLEKDPDMLKRYLVDAEQPDEDVEMNESNKDQFITRSKALELDEMVNKLWKQEVDRIVESDNYLSLKPAHVDVLKDAPDAIDAEHSVIQPDLGKIPGVEGYTRTTNDEDQMDDPTGLYKHAKLTTGLTKKEITSLLVKTLVLRYVSNQTRLGKVRSYSVIVMAGNGNGRLGIGMGKSADLETASMAATALAVRSMKPIRRYENRTIFGKVTSKVSGTVVEMESRPPGTSVNYPRIDLRRILKLIRFPLFFTGFGLRVPHRFYEMCRGAGIYDLAVKMPRSKNPMNSVKAAYKALLSQPDPEEIAVGRGKKLVDARKVYYGGSTL